MTDSPSEPQGTVGEEAAASGDPHAEYAARLADLVGAERWSSEHGSVHLHVSRDTWVDAIRTARDEAGLVFFSWLSAVDWAKDVAVGEPVDEEETLDERYEVIARVSSVTDASGAQFVVTIPKDDAWIDSIVGVFAGAGWHEREAAEMFGIDFRGHPNLTKLYLPDGFEGYPLRKSYPLLSREVKPWPGMVDVEDMPTLENTEAAAQEVAE